MTANDQTTIILSNELAHIRAHSNTERVHFEREEERRSADVGEWRLTARSDQRRQETRRRENKKTAYEGEKERERKRGIRVTSVRLYVRYGRQQDTNNITRQQSIEETNNERRVGHTDNAGPTTATRMTHGSARFDYDLGAWMHHATSPETKT